MKKKLNYFTKWEMALWSCSTAIIFISFIVFDRENFLTLGASLIGVTSLIFSAKGNPFGQILMIIFSLMYGIISFSFAYYGEMITYLGMTAPMAVFSLVAWLRNPYESGHSEVKVNRLSLREYILLLPLTAAVTIGFYFILKYFNTANIFFSTLSVATSFAAVYLTFRRSPYFAAAYAANDLVLIVLWSMAAFENISYISVLVCFVIFFINDIYGFFSWKKMEKHQQKGNIAEETAHSDVERK